MAKIEFINQAEKSKILKELERYGIKEIPFLLVKSGKEKIRAYSGSFRAGDITKIADSVPIETIGLYLAKIDGDEIRLSIDALHLLKNQIKENVLELTKEQTEEYLKGRDVELTEKQKELTLERVYYVIKNGEDFVGMAKIIQGRIKNYLPKERRIKN